MIPPNTNELKQHSNKLSDFGKDLHKLNGTGKLLVNAAVVVIALIAVMPFLTQMMAEIV